MPSVLSRRMDVRESRGRRRAARLLILGVVAAGALAVLGLVAYWPRDDAPDLPPQPNTYVDATVTAIDTQTCDDLDTGDTTSCRVVSARLTSGPDDGDEVEFQVRSTELSVPELHDGDDVVLLHVATNPTEFRYSFFDFQRRTPLLWLVVGFVVVVIVFGRSQGARALLGLAAAGAVLVAFVVPALLRDSPALPVVLAGTVAIAFAALYLAHGFKLGTTVALGGTLVALAITSGLAVAVASATHLTGLTDSAQVLRVTTEALDLRGLLVAGIVIGALGVLHDVTVSQVSTVDALRRANPGLPRRLLYREGMRVGRDHAASTVNTLVLAYAGASLPLLLFFAQGDQPVGRMLSRELVAVEIVRMVVGSIGLVAAVPITTGLAALVMVNGEVQRSDDGLRHTPWRDTARQPPRVAAARAAPADARGDGGPPPPG